MNKKSAAILIFFSIIIIFLIVFVNNTFINLLSHKTITSPTKQEEKWIANGPIHAILPASNNITYLGGDFTYIGPYTGGGVILNTINNQLITPFPKIDGVIIRVAIPDGKNGWYIGGEFSKIGELTRHNIAHILPNGTVDPNWNVEPTEIFSSGYINWSPDKEVYALALNHNGSILYVGGAFTKIGTKPRNGLAALDAKTGLPLEWNPQIDNGNNSVFALSLSHDGKILYVGGKFNTIGGKKRNGLAAIDTRTALATDWDPNPSLNNFFGEPTEQPTIYTLSLTDNGKILYVGGKFNNIGGKKRNGLAAIDTRTALATDWNPNPSNLIDRYGERINKPIFYTLSLTHDGKILYVGGAFNNIGGKKRIGLAALDTSTGLATNWSANVEINDVLGTLIDYDRLDGIVYSLALSSDGSVLYVGGWFDTIGGQLHPCSNHEEIYEMKNCYRTKGGETKIHFAAVDAKTGKVLPLNFNTNDEVYALSLSPNGSLLFIGGSFKSAGGEARRYLAAFNSLTNQLTSWNPTAEGNFVAMSHGSHVDHVILSLALNPDGSILYVGGNFDKAGGKERYNLAAIDTKAGLATDWNLQVEGTVRALSSSPDGSILYVGGNFKSIGGQKRNYLAAIDTKTGLVTDWNPDIQMAPSVLAEADELMPYWFGVFTFSFNQDGSILYVGGWFDSVGGEERHNLTAIDTKTGLVTDWNPNADSFVESLSSSPDGSILYVGGNFKSIGGQKRNYLAAIDTKTGLVTDWNPDICENRGDRCYNLYPKLFISSDGSVLYVVTNYVVTEYYDVIYEYRKQIITAIDTKSGQFLLNLPTKEVIIDSFHYFSITN